MTENGAKIKAQIANVSFGGIQIEGLLLPDGSFGLSSKQACVLLLDKEIKSRYKDRLTEMSKTKIGQKLIPEGLEFDGKIKVEQGSKGGSPYVDVLRLPLFEKLLRVAEKLGNQKASDLVDDLLGLSLHQLFCDAFKIKFEAAERQEWLTNRQLVKESFRKALTDSLKEYGYTEPWQYGRYVHAFQHSLGIEDGTRDSLSVEQLARLDSAQRYIGLAIRGKKQDPWQALKEYISTCNL